MAIGFEVFDNNGQVVFSTKFNGASIAESFNLGGSTASSRKSYLDLAGYTLEIMQIQRTSTLKNNGSVHRVTTGVSGGIPFVRWTKQTPGIPSTILVFVN